MKKNGFKFALLHNFSFAIRFIVMLFAAASLAAAADRSTLRTYTFKTIAAASTSMTNLQADVYSPSADSVRPVIVFIHGGALMMGDRKMSDRPGSLLEALLKAGYVVVSIDYRLAPETKLPQILEDMKDACAWVRRQGPELFHIDPEDVVVMGQS